MSEAASDVKREIVFSENIHSIYKKKKSSHILLNNKLGYHDITVEI
jgi:hypothetical protein